MISNIIKSILSITSDNVMLIILVICVISFFYFSFMYEGFDNKDACRLSMKGSALSKKAMSELNDLDTNMTRDQINIGYNYRDMQTRDIILEDEETNWCSKLSNEEKKQIEEEVSKLVDSEVVLFNGPGLIDILEKKSIDDGIKYAGTELLDDKYATV